MSEETTNQDVEAANTQTENNSAELTVTDLAAIKQIIDVASQRGAFRPNEMTTVGQIYTKLETFLNAVASQQNETQGE
jgi:cell division protein FtsL